MYIAGVRLIRGWGGRVILDELVHGSGSVCWLVCGLLLSSFVWVYTNRVSFFQKEHSYIYRPT